MTRSSETRQMLDFCEEKNIAPNLYGVISWGRILVVNPNLQVGSLSCRDLLTLHAEVTETLRERGITRSSNNPVGDLAEHLFCTALKWDRTGKSQKGFDAVGSDGKRYQIKGRRVTKHNKSRQLSALRELTKGSFDFLAGVVFAEDYSILRAAIIPHSLILTASKFVERTNSNRFLLRDELWDMPGVIDVTEDLRRVSL